MISKQKAFNRYGFEPFLFIYETLPLLFVFLCETTYFCIHNNTTL